jgi:hypothetical protein
MQNREMSKKEHREWCQFVYKTFKKAFKEIEKRKRMEKKSNGD